MKTLKNAFVFVMVLALLVGKMGKKNKEAHILE